MIQYFEKHFPVVYDAKTTFLIAFLVLLFIISYLIIQILKRGTSISRTLVQELQQRYRSWLILALIILIPIIVHKSATIAAITLLSLLCYREYARATGLFREHLVSGVVVLGILLLNFAAWDEWYRFFVAIFPLSISCIAIVAIWKDQPKGYIQRIGMATLGFALFGSCLGHLSYLSNDDNYRAILILIFLAVELNDIAAFTVGKLFGRNKLLPHTSPNKTIEGAVGSIFFTTLFVFTVGYYVFENTPLQHPLHRLFMGLIISMLGQCGDFMLSSVKRDIGIKDMSSLIPGHGGLLDRFDSIILVAPAIFYYLNYFMGVGNHTPAGSL
ncbi:MAG: phosphatidate cytidylyltransferase [Zavarzinella sp.]